MKTVSCHFHFPALSAGEDHIRLGPCDDREDASVIAGPQTLFHAAWSKNAYLAEALERLQPEPALLCDADVHFPADLKLRMEALLAKCPERGMLYGLAGRRSCRRVPLLGGPSIRLDRHGSVIGYVQFTKENVEGPWRTEARAWGGEHDDWRVYAQYGPERSVALPFGCYHVGGVRRHWGGYQGRLVGGEPGAVKQGEGAGAALTFAGGLSGARVVFLADGGTDHAVALLRAVPGLDSLLAYDPWELNQFPVERVEDLPVRLTGIAGWMTGKWEECRRRMLRGEAALPLSECVNSLFLDLIRWDRGYTRERFQREVGSVQSSVFSGEQDTIGALGKVKILGEGGADPLTEVADGEVDVIWLGGEIGYTPLLQEVPRLRGKFPVVMPSRPEAEKESRAGFTTFRQGRDGLATGGLVCGGFHDIWAWPESTACLEMLLGTPEVVTAGGEWLKRVISERRSVISRQAGSDSLITDDSITDHSYPLPIPLEVPEQMVPASRECGIVFYQNDRGEGTVEGLMLSLHSLRRHWRGEVAVLFSGEESPSVRIACARYGALYREVPEPEVAGDPRVVRRVFVDPEAQVREWGPYKKVLWVEAGLVGREREFAKWGKKVARHSVPRASEQRQGTECPATFSPPERVDVVRRDPGLESRQGELRAALEVEVMLAWAATARVRYDATVVIGLLPEDVAGFEKNWTATRWRHAAMTLEDESRIHEPVPVLLGLCGVTEAEVRHAMRHRTEARLSKVEIFRSAGEVDSAGASPHQFNNEPHWTYVLAAAAERAETEWLIYLDPMMHPSPGAELFLPHRLPGWGTEEVEKVVYAPGWAFRRIGEVERGWVRRVISNQ